MAKLDWLLAYPNPTDDSPYALTPLSIMQPGAMFRAKGQTVKYFDQRFDPSEMFDSLVKDAENVGVSCFTGKQSAYASDLLTRAKELNPKIITHVGGHHARLCTDDVKREPMVDNVWPERWYGENFFPWDEEDKRLWRRGDVQYQTSRGCSYNCLRGDTLVNTIYGKISIKELAETRKTVPVYTYKNGRVFITDAIRIQKTGENKELVRVRFTDGTHIDCTPDHRFLQFKWGNQHAEAREWEVEAKDLKPKSHVRAIKETLGGVGYRYITWGRRDRQLNSRMIMEYMLGRELQTAEQVHHIDRNKLNDHPDNLEYCESSAAHHKQHPEFAQRMRENNPAKSMTPEWREKITKAVTGKKRTLEQRLRYRDSKLGEKNPRWGGNVDGRSGRKSRIREVNHVVESVIALEIREDVYCMEVPASGWFFANDVLVHNCTFCALRSPWFAKEFDKIERELAMIAELRGGLDEISVTDPNTGQGLERIDGVVIHHDRIKRMRTIGAIFRKFGVRWDGNVRSDYITPEYADAIAESGCFSLEFGAESGNEEFLRKVIHKGHGVDSIKNANRLLRGTGVSVMNSFIKNMPRERHDQWLDTMELIDWIVDAAPEARISVYTYAPYPGGPSYKDACEGVDGYPKFIPPKTMKGWGELKLMESPVYWIAGLNFRMDNTRANFPGEDWKLIAPYVALAQKKWKDRDVDTFPFEEVSCLVKKQVAKLNQEKSQRAQNSTLVASGNTLQGAMAAGSGIDRLPVDMARSG